MTGKHMKMKGNQNQSFNVQQQTGPVFSSGFHILNKNWENVSFLIE